MRPILEEQQLGPVGSTETHSQPGVVRDDPAWRTDRAMGDRGGSEEVLWGRVGEVFWEWKRSTVVWEVSSYLQRAGPEPKAWCE